MSQQEEVIKALRDQLLSGLENSNGTAANSNQAEVQGTAAVQANADREASAAAVQELQQEVQRLQGELAAARSSSSIQQSQQQQQSITAVDHAGSPSSPASAANTTTGDGTAVELEVDVSTPAATSDAQQQQQQQIEELDAYTRQLEAQAMQREALLGGLLTQVSAQHADHTQQCPCCYCLYIECIALSHCSGPQSYAAAAWNASTFFINGSPPPQPCIWHACCAALTCTASHRYNRISMISYSLHRAAVFCLAQIRASDAQVADIMTQKQCMYL